jgi:hypothetical protein
MQVVAQQIAAQEEVVNKHTDALNASASALIALQAVRAAIEVAERRKATAAADASVKARKTPRPVIVDELHEYHLKKPADVAAESQA